MFSTKLLFAVLFVLYYCTTVSTDFQYYVVAESTTDCQPADGECHPLSFYVTHSSSYFTNNNTIFYFKKGTHVLTNSINITGVHNVSFIGLNHHAIIKSIFLNEKHLLVIYNSINISIVNITVSCPFLTCFKLSISCIPLGNCYGIHIKYSEDITIFNVRAAFPFTTTVYNSFEVTIYNSHIFYFIGRFDPTVHCYNTLEYHNLKLVDITLQRIVLNIQQGTSYVLNVTLDNITNLRFTVIVLNPNSLYSTYINHAPHNSYVHIKFQEFIGSASCQYPNISIPANSIVITNCYFIDEFIISFPSHVLSDQTILISSCSIYKGLQFVNDYYQAETKASILIVDTQLINGNNYISNIDDIIFSNVSISNSLNTGLVLVNSKLTINGSLTVSNNIGVNGGGMALYGNSQLEIHPNSNLTFIENHVSNKGGGIYSENTQSRTYYTTVCNIIYIPDTSNVSFYFINNTAAVGNDIYGIEFTYLDCPIDMSVFKTDINYTTPPNQVCFCSNSAYGCFQATSPRFVFPGQKIHVNVSLWDYSSHNTAGSIIRYLNDTYID